VFANLSTAELRRLEIPLPPLDEQRRIVDLIGSVDTTIDAAERTRDATRALRTALLEDLLSEERGREQGWRETTLGEVTDISIGRTPPRSEKQYWSTSLDRPFCTIADMQGKWVIPCNEGVSELAEKTGKARRVPRGSLLFSFKLTIGRVGIAAVDLFPNEAIAVLEPTGTVLRDYLALALEQSGAEERGSRAVKGVTLNREALKGLPILLPPLDEQRRIVEVVSSVDERLEAEEAELVALRHLRASLLEDLLSGDHEIPEDYDRLLEKATRPGSSSSPEDTVDVP